MRKTSRILGYLHDSHLNLRDYSFLVFVLMHSYPCHFFVLVYSNNSGIDTRTSKTLKLELAILSLIAEMCYEINLVKRSYSLRLFDSDIINVLRSIAIAVLIEYIRK